MAEDWDDEIRLKPFDEGRRQDLLSHLGRRRTGDALGRTQVIEPEFHRVEPDLRDATVPIRAHRHDAAVPDPSVIPPEETLAEPFVELGGGRRPGVLAELLVPIHRERMEARHLKQEIAETVEDRPAVIDLDPAELMGPVPMKASAPASIAAWASPGRKSGGAVLQLPGS